VGQGVSHFVAGARDWHSLGDAEHGIAGGLASAGHFLTQAGGEAVHGVDNAAKTAAGLGVPGILGTAAGLGDVAVTGAGHLASQLWNWIAD